MEKTMTVGDETVALRCDDSAPDAQDKLYRAIASIAKGEDNVEEGVEIWIRGRSGGVEQLQQLREEAHQHSRERQPQVLGAEPGGGVDDDEMAEAPGAGRVREIVADVDAGEQEASFNDDPATVDEDDLTATEN